jgi:hypothetical protein
LERLVTAGLKAETEDVRLGDLSEVYVRTYERTRIYFGDTPSAQTMSHLAADIRYLCAAANVILFARTVDPGVRVREPAVQETVALDLKERTMTMLHTTLRKLMLPALLLVGSAFLVNGAVNAWTTWKETEALIVGLQREKAEALAAKIHQYIATLQDQIAWTTADREPVIAPDQRRIDYLRLLRQVPAIAEVAYLGADGKEAVRISRGARDTMDSGADFSADARFTEALKRNQHVGPVYFNERSDPFVSLARAHAGPNRGVTLAEVNIKRLWEFVDVVKLGESGYAYVVDGKGRVIASRHSDSAWRQSDLSALPQVMAAAAGAQSDTPSAGAVYDTTSPSGTAVLSVHAAVPSLTWKVFVELPAAEARAPLWSALVRAAWLLGLGLLAIVLAGLAATRRDMTPKVVRA